MTNEDARMELVVKIDEETYNDIKKGKVYTAYYDVPLEAALAIANGTPLPKGHGRLFDERDIVNGNYTIIGNKIYEIEPIIEADKTESAEWVDDKCSVCGKGIEDLIESSEWYRNEKPKYCPFCGMKIKAESEEA